MLLCVFCGACKYNVLSDEHIVYSLKSTCSELIVETRAEVYEGKALDMNYFVTADDLLSYLEFSGKDCPNRRVKNIESYGLDDSHTLFYVVNYETGWEVVAADKRVQPCLAHNQGKGHFTMDCDNEPMKFWMDIIAKNILRYRLNDNEIEQLNTENNIDNNEEDNVQWWNYVVNASTRLPDPLTPIIGPVDRDHYVYLIHSDTVDIVRQYGPYVLTTWGQKAPWNEYCPYKTDGSGLRSPAGCTVVAASQMLYYLKFYYNLEIVSPTDGYCIGNVNGYQTGFSDFTTDSWYDMALSKTDSIPNEYTDVSALLIAHTGQLCEVDYGNSGSSASMADTPETVFAHYGILCNNYNSYDEDIIENCMRLDEMPVMIEGWTTMLLGSGHAWLIDGYKKEYTQITNYYASFEAIQPPHIISLLGPEHADFTQVLENNVSREIHMNWGWGEKENFCWNGWYSMVPEDWLDEDHNYEHRIKMIFAFRK